MKPAALAFLALASCGFSMIGLEPDRARDITVERYETPHDTSLGYAWGPMSDGFHIALNLVLADDDDPLRFRNVAVHELLNVLALDHGVPPDMDPSWFLFDGDTKGEAQMVEAEAAWAAQFGPYTVNVECVWCADAVWDAVDFVNAACGEEVFR